MEKKYKPLLLIGDSQYINLDNVLEIQFHEVEPNLLISNEIDNDKNGKEYRDMTCNFINGQTKTYRLKKSWANRIESVIDRFYLIL